MIGIMYVYFNAMVHDKHDFPISQDSVRVQHAKRFGQALLVGAHNLR